MLFRCGAFVWNQPEARIGNLVWLNFFQLKISCFAKKIHIKIRHYSNESCVWSTFSKFTVHMFECCLLNSFYSLKQWKNLKNFKFWILNFGTFQNHRVRRVTGLTIIVCSSLGNIHKGAFTAVVHQIALEHHVINMFSS